MSYVAIGVERVGCPIPPYAQTTCEDHSQCPYVLGYNILPALFGTH